MTTQAIADRLVALCRTGKYMEAVHELYADDIISLEPEGTPMPRIEGKAGVVKKGEEWLQMIATTHDGHVSDPIVAGSFFSCAMTVDVTLKSGDRMKMEEICVYGVKNGKIASEQFFFPLGG